MSGNSNFLQFALDTSKIAGKIQLKYFGNLTTIDSKTSTIDLLTKADTKSEDFIISTIKKTFPRHSKEFNTLTRLRKISLTNSNFRHIPNPTEYPATHNPYKKGG